jgi:uroporphyrinogen-III decarboxylase
MSQIMKGFMGVFLTLFMAVTAIGILSAYMEVMSAQDMQARIVDEIENSDFNSGVIKECYKQCEQAGYQLAITLFCDDAAMTTIHSGSEVPSVTEGVQMAKVEMSFQFRVAFLGINKTHTYVSYAR